MKAHFIIWVYIGLGVAFLTRVLGGAEVSQSTKEAATRDRCIHHLRGAAAELFGKSSNATRAALQATVDIYVHDQFDCDEIGRVFASMYHLISTATIASDGQRQTAADIAYPQKRADAMFAWVNPTCPHCRDVIRILTNYQRLDTNASAVIFRLLPAKNDEVSQYAAIGLEVVRRRHPEMFAPLVIEMLEQQPGDVAAIDAELHAVLGGPVGATPEFDAARKHIAGLLNVTPEAFTAPRVCFRGRWLVPDNAGGLAFDPLRDAGNLQATILAIRDYDTNRRRNSE